MQSRESITKQLVLTGGGLPHLHCLRRLREAPLEGARVTVVSPSSAPVYSGMLPGWVEGRYALDDCRVPIGDLARAIGAELVLAAAESIDLVQRRLSCTDGTTLRYDILSLDVGSAIDAAHLPGTDLHGIAVRPLEAFVAGWTRAKQGLEARGRGAIVVVGAGAGGVELALAARQAFASAPGVRVAIVSTTPALPGRSGPRLTRLLREAGIVVHSGIAAVRIDERTVELADGTRLDADAAIVATGSAAPGWLAASGLTVDAAGYVVVDRTLRAVARPDVFASGDCASLDACPQPKSGVHALRMGPTLLDNLRRTLAGRPLVPHTPRQRALHLMNAGDGYAVGAWGSVAFEGRWAWRWKDRIDRAFIARHSPGAAITR